MNNHIALVKKWLANPKSVTQEELLDNKDAAFDAVDAAYADSAVAAYAAYAACAAYAAKAAKATKATHWVKRYEELMEQE